MAMDASNDLMLDQTRKILTLEGRDNRLLQLNETVPRVKLDDISPEKIALLVAAGTRVFQRHTRDLQDFFNPHSSHAWGSDRRTTFQPSPLLT